MSLTIRAAVLVCAAALLAGCAAKRPVDDEAVPPAWLKDVPVQPLEVVEYRAAEAEGEHALFLRLSRFPDSIAYTVTEEPPELVIQMQGPAVGEDIPEERIVVSDSLIPAVRVSRKTGDLTIVVEVLANEVPPYLVDEAADWVTVRLRPGQE